MPLHISVEPPRQDPPIPDDKAHRANDEALRARDAMSTRAAFERDLRTEIEHPVHRKIVDALHGRQLVLYGLLALALIAVAWWEWKVSRDIYEVTLPVSPWIPFSVFFSLAFVASALLAEGIPAFSLGFAAPRTAGPDKAMSAIESLYGRPRTKGLSFDNISSLIRRFREQCVRHAPRS